jgi:hypothetical protein
MLEQARSELYVEMDPHDAAYMLIKIVTSGPACRASCAQEYSAGYAQDLDEIRALWMAMAKRREALSVRDAHAMFDLWLGLVSRPPPVSRTAPQRVLV